ncbi:virulence-associated protein E [Pseudomonas cavernae]|uniref:Virulence-associated protein E n=1 Tax=Pseudomonas cavernae TaxID=2320867 RepID=A0A385Z7B9_9PSED|nr:virulence-associated protein E [Pseudomonas cavernae]
MMPIDRLLSAMGKVKQTKPGQWVACCPAHDDRTPSLKISETQDGTVLLKCWAGCSAAEIMSAMGLGLRDLFPGSGKPRRSGPSRQAIEREKAIIACAMGLVAQGHTLNSEHQARLELARRRLSKLGVPA